MKERTTKSLITPNEAAKISASRNTVEEVYRARDYYKAYLELFNKKFGNIAPLSYKRMWALAAVYQAGRIQGMREERSKK